ncbi:hypothetical protein BDW02DRAFT_155462 [Decorospora gaudefroyi]|uniref:Fungal N-terminal domain-containing protein n=1 Tax=Decorospora gaudefroyi TaxID=184978 RepID=A0A6A5KTJ8_9PLEO|nr:hypothetical protein BDW02DRAFT_155462 [Decorospora gaudefroyi]
MSFGFSIGDIIKLCELAGRVYKNCRDCSGEYNALTSQARTLSNLLGDIQDKYDKIPQNKRQQLIDACEPCIEVLGELDQLVLHYNRLDTKTKRAFDRITFDPDRSRNIRERLISSVSMLSAFYTSLIHDSQVLILEALERLERYYKGGHREESIASVERLASGTAQDYGEVDDGAWSQILRDLEDVNISEQQALSYRDVIVSWLVAAVNEGRLLEERPEQETFSSMSQDLGTALTDLHFTDQPHSFDVPVSDTASLYTRPEPTPPIAAITHAPDPSSSAPIRLTSSRTSPATSPMRSTVLPTSESSVSTTGPAPAAATSYYEEGTSITVDLERTARQIVAAWAKQDFVTAEKYLEDQLTAVEHGQTCISGTQPDRRILRHLIGVCASFNGNFDKAKRFFESVFNGIYLNRLNLDDGDIAAARWLGDACLHTHEHTNAVLAYSVAYEGSIGRFGANDERTRRVAVEIQLLDYSLLAFDRIETSLIHDADPTTIYMSTNFVEKRDLLMSVKNSLCDAADSGIGYLAPSPLQIRSPFTVGPRSKFDLIISEGFLLGPLVSLSTWPWRWDPTFYLMDAVQLDRYMYAMRHPTFFNRPLSADKIARNPLGESKKLNYCTKRGGQWLIDAVKEGLQDMGIEHAEQSQESSIICCLNQQRDGVAFSEGVEICFRKVPFRDVYGIKISEVRWATRRLGAATQDVAQNFRDTTVDFRNTVKCILERAEAGTELAKPMLNIQFDAMNVHSKSPQGRASLFKQRPTYG